MTKVAKKILIIFFFFLLVLSPSVAKTEEGDFFFAPEVGWSHLFSSALKEGIFTGAHFGYDTSNNLTIELGFFYGDNNGKESNPDLRYILSGGGISYKILYNRLKPSVFAGATIVALDFSSSGAVYKAGLYAGGALEFYLNKVVSVGVLFKYLPIIKSDDILLLGFRLGFEL